VIEIDGDSHAEPDQASYDAERTQWLQEHAYRVIRPAAAQQVEDDLEGMVCPSRSLSRPFDGVYPACPGRRPGSCAEGLRIKLVEGLGMLPEDHRDFVREGDTRGVRI